VLDMGDDGDLLASDDDNDEDAVFIFFEGLVS